MGLEPVVVVLVVMVRAVVGRVAVLTTFSADSFVLFFAQDAKTFSSVSSDMSAFLERRSNLKSNTHLTSSMANDMDLLC